MIYILLPVHNRKAVTQRFVRCLKAQTYKDYHLLLIDDGSTDGTEEMVRSEISDLTIIKGQGTWWWGGSLHQGYQWIKTNNVNLNDLVLMINDDTEFDTEFLETGLTVYGSRSRALLQAQAYSKQTGKLIEGGAYIDWKKLPFSQATETGEVNCLTTRGLLLRVSDFLEIGGFHPTLLPHYDSDTEFTLRAFNKGMFLWTHPAFHLRVDESLTGASLAKGANITDLFKILFSRKCPSNPINHSIVVALACPWKWKLLNWFFIWYRVGKGFIRVIKRKINQNEHSL